jgi:beta-1,4-mannooligosaccharide/beta-1,4-mannosyl-N-acetylglucosamine phosphorylase
LILNFLLKEKVLTEKYTTNPVITRCEENPVLTAEDIPYDATQIFNAGICKYKDKYVMVFRNDVGAEPGNARVLETNMGIAWSDDGIHWEAEPEPWIKWQTDEISRAYDPRITMIEDRCYLCFAVDTKHGIRGGIAVTDDFREWKVLSLSAPDNRNMVMFPEKINGKFARLERPFPIYGRGAPEAFDLWFSDSPDCAYWGNTQLVLGSEQVPYANCKIGPGAPPVKTDKGWLTLFHAVYKDEERELFAWHKNWHKIYMIGIMLLDLDMTSLLCILKNSMSLRVSAVMCSFRAA